MDTQPLFGLQQLLNHIVGDVAQAVCRRRDEPQPRQIARAQAAAQTILAFLPADAIEAMIAGHCVMLHELIVDSVQITLRGELDATRRATRSGIVAMDKAFGTNLVRLERYRTRHAESTEDATPADIPAEIEIADRVHRHQSGAPRTEAAQRGVAQREVVRTEPAEPSPAPITLRPATPEASPPPASPHPPHILGIDRPPEASPGTVAPMPGLNRQARRAISRQDRKRIDPGTSPIANANFGRHI